MVLYISYTVPKKKKNHSVTPSPSGICQCRLTNQFSFNFTCWCANVTSKSKGEARSKTISIKQWLCRWWPQTNSPSSSSLAGFFFWSPHLQAVIITGPYCGTVASGFILARDTTPPLVAVSRPLWVHELGVQSLEKFKLFNLARSQILLNVFSRIIFCKKLPSFWGWEAWQHLANIICSFFVYNFVKREQEMQKPWIVHTIHEKGMSKIVSDCFSPFWLKPNNNSQH